MLIDTHAHLFNEYYDDIETVINDAKKNNVLKYISNAVDIKTCYEMIELSKKFDSVYITLGIHPETPFEDISELEKTIKSQLDNKKFVGIGEIGLDYHYGKENKERQIEIFDYQLSLAEEYNLPVVIHSRDATKDTIDVLKKHHVRGVVHCFSGSLETAKIYMDMGLVIGVGGVMTFKNSNIDQIIKAIPLDKLILETDSPYLTPEPFRKYSNEPKYIATIAEYLANLKGVTKDTICTETTKTANKVFNLTQV